jgi:hypothetical protein
MTLVVEAARAVECGERSGELRDHWKEEGDSSWVMRVEWEWVGLQ